MISEPVGNNSKLIAAVWVDIERRYFISLTSSTSLGNFVVRRTWRQTEDGPKQVDMEIQQPKLVEKYYAACAKIDQHNRSRQHELKLERKIQTKT